MWTLSGFLVGWVDSLAEEAKKLPWLHCAGTIGEVRYLSIGEWTIPSLDCFSFGFYTYSTAQYLFGSSVLSCWSLFYFKHQLYED